LLQTFRKQANDPIWIYQGQILDGRNRYKACREVGVEIATIDFDPETHGDPTDWVIAKDLKRRHLNESQRAMVAAKLANMQQGNFSKAANLPVSPVSKAAANLLNVGDRTVRDAKAVQAKAAPELKAAVEQGHLAVSVGAKAASLPTADQRAIAEKAKAGDTNAAERAWTAIAPARLLFFHTQLKII
jgi:hypothetical protein